MKAMAMRYAALAALVLAVQASAQSVSMPERTRVELDNGAVLILSEKHEVPLIGLQAIVKSGAVADPDGKNGIASLTASLLEKGAGKRSAAEFAEAIESVGGSLSAGAGLEAVNISANFMADDADLMVELLSDMLMRPRLEEAEMNKLRERTINFIRAAKDNNLDALVPIYGSAWLFGDHPYGNPVSGSEETLAAISHDDLLAWYANEFGGDRLIVSVSGDFDTRDMRRKLTRAFAKWKPAKRELANVAPPAKTTGRRVLLIDKPGATQTYFWLANVGVAADYEHAAALDLANTVFGGRFTSMLNTELRVKSGLTYGARSSLTRPSEPGSVAISSFTRTDATTEAIDMALGVLSTLHDEGVNQEMLESARNYVLGQLPTRIETASQLAGQFAILEAYGLPENHLEQYVDSLVEADTGTLASVIDEVYPLPENLVFVLLGDAALIREAVARYGTLEEVSISKPTFRLPQGKESRR